jgi:hypothetical protein
MSSRATLKDIHSGTSSRELEGGATPCVSLDGQTLYQCVPAPAHASLSPRQAKSMGLLTSATSGQRSIGISSSANFQSSLESRLRVRLDVSGSQEYALIWKHWPMISLVPICALRASALHMSGSGYFGLPTPQAIDSKGSCGKLSYKRWTTYHLKHWTHGTMLAVHSSSGVSSWPNPMLVEWLMGYPLQWISGHDYTPTEMRLFHK